jgi:hypothetical protein
MEQILSNINSLLSLFDINTNDNYCYICISLTTYYLSDFNCKLEKHDDSLIDHINYFLELINSKFLLKKELSDQEFINYILYLFYEYDIIDDYINYLKNYEKENISISIDKLINLQNFTYKSQNGILKSFNKMNHVFINLKNQIDLFINLAYKLNKIKNTQEKPIKYDKCKIAI